MRLIIREANVNDAQGVINILNPIIEDRRFTVLDSPFSLEEEEIFIRDFPERGVFHVAVDESDEKIVGFQSLEPFANFTKAFDHVATIGTYVGDDYRRQGIANKLFEATFASAKAKGFEKIFTYVRSDNPGALRTYQSQGFKVIGTAEKQAKINGRYIDEYLIEKFL